MGIQSAGELVPETFQLRILHSAEEDNLSPFDSKIACLCQSIEFNYNKYIHGAVFDSCALVYCAVISYLVNAWFHHTEMASMPNTLSAKVWISIKISLKVVPRGPFNNIKTLVHIMACRRPDDEPLSEPITLLTHICVTRSQWMYVHYYGRERPAYPVDSTSFVCNHIHL